MKRFLKNNSLWAVLLLLCQACSLLKDKQRTAQQSEWNYQQQLVALNQTLQSLTQLTKQEELQQRSDFYELKSDSLVYWHPQEGFTFKPGPLSLRYSAAATRSSGQTALIAKQIQKNSDSLILQDKQFSQQERKTHQLKEQKGHRPLLWAISAVAVLVVYVFLKFKV